MNVSEYAQSVPLVNGGTRVDCPSCGGKNTFTITRRDGALVWNCYRAECRVRGATRSLRSVSEMEEFLNKDTVAKRDFIAPDYFTSWQLHSVCTEYLKNNHSYDAAMQGRASVQYDPKEHRIVFLIYDDYGNLIDATGRHLGTDDVPKWRRYGTKAEVLIVKSNYNRNTAVLVEDAASASACSEVATGVALLGTTLLSYDPLYEYTNIIVALDPDALQKALKISAELKYWFNSQVVSIEDDLKYYGAKDIERIIGLKREGSESALPSV